MFYSAEERDCQVNTHVPGGCRNTELCVYIYIYMCMCVFVSEPEWIKYTQHLDVCQLKEALHGSLPKSAWEQGVLVHWMLSYIAFSSIDILVLKLHSNTHEEERANAQTHRHTRTCVRSHLDQCSLAATLPDICKVLQWPLHTCTHTHTHIPAGILSVCVFVSGCSICMWLFWPPCLGQDLRALLESWAIVQESTSGLVHVYPPVQGTERERGRGGSSH